MPHHTPLIGTIVAGLVLAFILGSLAHRLKVSPLVGYLLAGVLVGPFTPGYVADQALAQELAEIGVILLMFGVGLHFSLKDLLSVRATAIPGAIAQITVATLLGAGLGTLLGWPIEAGLMFGFALSVASTVVLLRALQEHRLVETERGRIAVGWLIVEDLVMILALVLIPVLASASNAEGAFDLTGTLTALAITIGKVAAFVVLILVVGRRVIPWILHHTAHSGSRELFRLAVLAIALGVAFGAALLFGVSFALGAFFAGMVMSESALSQQAANETLPLRDAFAVLFFVSVGMLVDPSVLWLNPWPLIATVLIILIGKSLAAFAIVRAFGQPSSTALTISTSLAQIGEFSFILATLGVGLGLLPKEGQDLILAAAIITIMLNPALFAAAVAFEKRRKPAIEAPEQTPEPVEAKRVIIVGYGRVGSVIADGVAAHGATIAVIEDQDSVAALARRNGLEVVPGNAADVETLVAAKIREAHCIFVAIPNGFEAGQIVQKAKAVNPGLTIVARAHSDDEAEHLRRLGASKIIMGERELALAMVDAASLG
ncbi:MAG: YbaL family putative K(+) efflux transporter [Alphaproteobacteria bacterium]|mgnify:CR=1 FL=1|jgi:CPA2 family monovalent cation:H+ antiporter-2|nr:YbaL family putative K(+) efflux transporter [Alphaproteobacteria bacterium]